MSRCDPSQGLLWMYVCKMGTGFISRQNYTEKRLTLQSPCHHVVMPVRRTIITSVISILRMICKTQSPLYSIPGSVPRLLHIQNYIQTFRSAKACQKMQRVGFKPPTTQWRTGRVRCAVRVECRQRCCTECRGSSALWSTNMAV